MGVEGLESRYSYGKEGTGVQVYTGEWRDWSPGMSTVGEWRDWSPGIAMGVEGLESRYSYGNEGTGVQVYPGE